MEVGPVGENGRAGGASVSASAGTICELSALDVSSISCPATAAWLLPP